VTRARDQDCLHARGIIIGDVGVALGASWGTASASRLWAWPD
jgi:hypothetical protein